eukprot:g14233.t1 g14233   contig9:1440461-1441174(-)
MKTTLASVLAAALLSGVYSFTPVAPSTVTSRGEGLEAVNGIWNTGNDFGKGKFRFFDGFDSYMKPFPDEDRELYPSMFQLPKGVYEVPLAKPCGIIFEEIEANRGVYIADLVENGNAERQGILKKGDVLVGVTAIRVAGAKWERRLLPARKFGFDLVVNAIGSNEDKWGCNNVILMVERPDEANTEEVDEFLQFFEPSPDTPWKLPV